MKVFALTGGSGVGKAAVSSYMREKGVYIIDADEVSHEVVKQGTQCFDEIVATFGTELIKEDGELDRKRLGNIVFNDATKLKTLNKITHHYIFYKIQSILNNLDCEYVIIDGAVIIGNRFEALCDFIVVVDAGFDVRMKRIMKRDNLSETAARARLNSQPDSEFYISHADYVIHNNTTLEDLKTEVDKVYKQIAERLTNIE